jgi:hypothetical protein
MNNNDNIDNITLGFLQLYEIISYIKNNFIQFLLLILVFIIIYTVDYISNINANLFNIQSQFMYLPTLPLPPLLKEKQQNKNMKIKNIRNKKK